MRTGCILSPPITNHTLVRDRDRKLAAELVAVVATVLLVGAAAVGYTWMRLEILQTGYRIGSLEAELHQLLQRERLLELDVSRLSSPEAVDARARAELGMRPPEPEQVIFSEELQ